MLRDKEVVVVCGYGVKLTPNLRHYLDEVVRYLDGKDTHVEVITSGGFTNPREKPNVSEAGLMAGYLRSKNGFRNDIFREDRALTTLQNLRFAKKHLSQRRPPQITIFCDSVQAFKVEFLAKRIFRGSKVVVRGIDFGRTEKETIIQLCLSTPLVILGYYLPPLDWFLLWLRKKKCGITT